MAKKKNSTQPVEKSHSSPLASTPPSDSEKKSTAQDEPNHIPIIGIGASAGGLEAFKIFFSYMQPDSGMAFVLIQHMSPEHDSALVELVQRFTTMTVLPIDKAIVVEPNCVYITPPNRQISIVNNTLQPIGPVSGTGHPLPIDFFFQQLAADQEMRSIGIVLTGTGSDGCAGLQAIHAAGGMVMVQNPETAAYAGMPVSAIETGLVDYVLPLEEIPRKLLEYTKHTLDEAALHVDENVSTRAELLQQIFILIRARTGHDFSFYKQNTIGRRIQRRMMVNHIMTLHDYVLFAQKTPDEIETLFQELLIGVTSFFRDPEAFAYLGTHIIPALLEPALPIANRDTSSADEHSSSEEQLGSETTDIEQTPPRDQEENGTVRIWVPGCATGEEAYSIAILVQEHLNKYDSVANVQIFATDIDKQSIEKARSGRFSKDIAAALTPERLNQFFQREDKGYVISKQIRELIVFAEQSVIKDSPFSKLDLIACRNLMIYWNPALQKMVLPIFHYALKPGGILFLGSSETIGEFDDIFETVNRKWKIYRAVPHSPGSSIPVEIRPRFQPPMTEMAHHHNSELDAEPRIQLRDIAEELLFANYLPSAVIVNRDGDALHFYGRTGKYLEPASGDSSFNVFAMARPGLQASLAMAVHKVAIQKKSVVVENVRVQTNGDFQTINLVAQSIDQSVAGQTGLILIVFEDAAPAEIVDPTVAPIALAETEPLVHDLLQELSDTKEFLQATIEELETANQELKSTNEELQSANEELQSTNEELETSKEELQSLNEELVTVNNEHELKNEALSDANNDLNNLLASTNIATIFLDTELAIKRFTPTATSIVNLIMSDIGRPLSHTVSKVVSTSLVDAASIVLRTLAVNEAEVETDDGRHYLMKITPYRTTENVIDGVVMTFVDLTDQKLEQSQLKEAETRFQATAFNSPNTIYIFDLVAKKPIFINREVFLGYTQLELLALNSLASAVHPDDLTIVQSQWNELTSGAKETVETIEYRIQNKNGHWEWLQSRMAVLSKDSSGNAVQVLVVLSLITKRKRIEVEWQDRRQLLERIAKTIPLFLYVYDIADGRNIYVNTQRAEFIGITPENAQQFGFADLFERIHSDDRDALEKRKAQLDADTAGEVYEIEARIKIEEGQWRLVRLRDTVFTRDKNGKPKQCLGTVENITVDGNTDDG